MTLKELAIEHTFYCINQNYYSKDAGVSFNTFKDFYEYYRDADIDLNMPFRFDIYAPEAEDEEPEYREYRMEIFIISQRNGLFRPIRINKVEEDDVPQILEYLNKAWIYMKSLWEPISNDEGHVTQGFLG